LNPRIAIIGGGPGGYVTAIRLKQYEFDVTVYEKERLGGVCLNWGCIPTKALVKNADLYHEIKNSEEFGITIPEISLDYAKISERKNKVVDTLVSGIEFVFKKKQIPVIYKTVNSISKHDDIFTVITNDSVEEYTHVILATGSVSKELPFMQFNGKEIISSNDILKMTELPKHLTVIGGGVIGCEFSSIFSQLDVDVEIVEFLPNLVPFEDEEISKRLAMALKKIGIKIHLKTSVTAYRKEEGRIVLSLSNGKEIITDKVLVSVGRNPDVSISFKGFNLELSDKVFKINDYFQTSENNIFAIGDLTGKQLLAHTASKQGLIVAEFLKKTLKENTKPDQTELIYENIPRCIFTNPEIASVGLTESQAEKKYGTISVGKFPFTANGKAIGLGNTFGFVKTIAEKSGKIVGMHIIGPHATELIAQGAILINKQLSTEDIHNIVFAHPTLSEAVAESIEDLENLSIHKV